MENIHENGTFQLHNKVEIPQVGFGTWQMGCRRKGTYIIGF